MRELVEAEDEEGFVDLVPEDGGLDTVGKTYQYGPPGLLRQIDRDTHRWRGRPFTLTMGLGPRRGYYQVSNSFHMSIITIQFPQLALLLFINHPQPLDSIQRNRESKKQREAGKLLTAQWATAVAVFFLPKHWTL